MCEKKVPKDTRVSVGETRPKGQNTFEKDPGCVPIANKSRAPARAMTEPILKQNLPRIEQDLALIRRLLAFLANEIDFSPSLAFA